MFDSPELSRNGSYLLWIGVNYKNYSETLDLVKSALDKLDNDKFEFVVVDNTPSIERESILTNEFVDQDNVHIVELDDNPGFYPGAARAFANYLQLRSAPEWTIVSNTDIEISDPDLLDSIASAAARTEAAVLAPSIISTLTGNDQNPQIRKRPSRNRWRSYLFLFRFYPIFIAYMATSVVKNTLLAKLTKRANGSATRDRPSEQETIYAPHGSVVLFRKSFFEAGGTIEHGVMLFGETISIAEQAIRLGLDIVYEPRISFRHREHSTTGRIKSPKIAKLQYQASVYCWEKYFR